MFITVAFRSGEEVHDLQTTLEMNMIDNHVKWLAEKYAVPKGDVTIRMILLHIAVMSFLKETDPSKTNGDRYDDLVYRMASASIIPNFLM